MDGGAWWATVHRVAKSQTQLWEELKEKKKDEAGFYAGKLLSLPRTELLSASLAQNKFRFQM